MDAYGTYDKMVQDVLDQVYEAVVELQGRINWDKVLKQSDRIEMPDALVANDSGFHVVPIGANNNNYNYMMHMRSVCAGSTIIGINTMRSDDMDDMNRETARFLCQNWDLVMKALRSSDTEKQKLGR